MGKKESTEAQPNGEKEASASENPKEETGAKEIITVENGNEESEKKTDAQVNGNGGSKDDDDIMIIGINHK